MQTPALHSECRIPEGLKYWNTHNISVKWRCKGQEFGPTFMYVCMYVMNVCMYVMYVCM
jgi:hypothetical protein